MYGCESWNMKKVKVKVKSFSRARLFATPWTVACTKLLCPWDFQGKSTGVELSTKEFMLFFFFLTLFYFTVLYWFCHTLTWIHHWYTWVPNPEPPFHLPPCIISLGHPSAPAPSILYPVSNLDWQLVSYMIVYMFQCHSPKSSHPLPLPQSPKVCSIHLCLFCCLTYRVIITIFLNSIYMC